ncbi:unnamed protein product [Ambrosiozyma monospora]|uniref:Unnamed protein product n=1 Tax=Ambrosiozyma monospora TaxID=43982 RepID=A0ACB5SYM0_AMBMO|nr:unnamed protein product [Ambrosiozyma monospora]
MSEAKVFTADEVAEHNTKDDLYLICDGKVYDCTEYLDEHPGGEEVILDCAGTDATEPFEDIGHSEDAREVLAGLYVGELKGGAVTKKQQQVKVSDGNVQSPIPMIAALGCVIALCAYFIMKE